MLCKKNRHPPTKILQIQKTTNTTPNHQTISQNFEQGDSPLSKKIGLLEVVAVGVH